MYKGNKAEIKMIRNILDEGYEDNTIYECEVLADDLEEGKICLRVDEELPEFLLDGLYECIITEDETMSICNGMIIERYENKVGRVLVFQTKNGFYKKLLN